MTDSVAEDGGQPPNQFMRDFGALPVRLRQLNLAPFVVELLDILLRAKAGTDIVISRDLHPELGDVGEDALYSFLRKVLLESLRKSRRRDLRQQAERLLPDHLFPITKGQVAWNRDEVESLRSKLDAACTEAGLDRFRDIPAVVFRGVSNKVFYIIEQTRQAQAARRPLPVASVPIAASDGKSSWQRYLEDKGYVEDKVAPATLAFLTRPRLSPQPRPLWMAPTREVFSPEFSRDLPLLHASSGALSSGLSPAAPFEEDLAAQLHWTQGLTSTEAYSYTPPPESMAGPLELGATDPIGTDEDQTPEPVTIKLPPKTESTGDLTKRKSKTWTHRRVMQLRDEFKREFGPECVSQRKFVNWLDDNEYDRRAGFEDVPSFSTVRDLSADWGGWSLWWHAAPPGETK